MPTLIEQAKSERDAADKIAEAAKAQNRELSLEDSQKVNDHLDAAESFEAQHAAEQEAAQKRAEAMDRLEASRAAAKRPEPRKAAPGSDQPRPGATRAPAVVRENVLDDPKRGFKSLGDFGCAVADAYSPGGSFDSRLRAAAGDGITQGVLSEGGVFVPPAFSASVWDGLRTRSDSMLARCDQVTLDPSVESMTFPAIAETSRADGSRWGGLRGYWKSELTSLTASRPAFREVTVKPNELYVFAYVSDKMLRNSPVSMDSFLGPKAADEINFKVGDAIWNGTGAGQPRGVLAGGALISVTKETGQAAATVVAQNIIKMFARLHPAARSGAAWFMSPQVETQLWQMSLVAGVAGQLAFLPPGGLSGSPYATMLGLPIVVTEFNAALGTVGDIVLANLKFYLAATKGQVDRQVSMHLKFDYAQTAFRFIWEVDGTPWIESAVTPFKDTNYTQSAFVALATRA